MYFTPNDSNCGGIRKYFLLILRQLEQIVMTSVYFKWKTTPKALKQTGKKIDTVPSEEGSHNEKENHGSTMEYEDPIVEIDLLVLHA